ncbi:NUDIX domain-containing protein [Candidatus Kuenenbacteria bacterium]|nr:NUDIX domain-containing protein [Candidatus Kuenenbacteria bacterium]
MLNNVISQVVLGAVIFSGNKVLIVQRNKDENIFPNMWELPSGKKELLEGCITSLLREIKEETGLRVKVINILSVFNYQIKKEKIIKDCTQINFLVRAVGHKVVISKEHQDYAWISKNHIRRYNLSKETKKVIRQGFKLIYKK